MVEKSLAVGIPQLIVEDSLQALADIARAIRDGFANQLLALLEVVVRPVLRLC